MNELITKFNEYIANERYVVLFNIHDLWIRVSKPVRLLNHTGGLYSLLIREADERVFVGVDGVLLSSTLLTKSRIIPINSTPLKWLGANINYPKDYNTKQT